MKNLIIIGILEQFKTQKGNKMKKISTALLLLTILTMNCKSDSTELLSYKGGEIKRSELKAWLELQKLKTEDVMNSKKYQEKYLTDMAVEQIAAKEAEKSGLADKIETKTYISVSIDNYAARTFIDTSEAIVKNYKEKAYDLQYIYISYSGKKEDPSVTEKQLTDAEMAELKNSAKDRLNKAMENLSKGKDFSKTAEEFSEDYTKEEEGKIGYVLTDMIPPQFVSGIAQLKSGEYTKNAVEMQNGFYILKLNGVKDVDVNSVAELTKDDYQIERMKNAIRDKAIAEYLENIKKNTDIVFNEAAIDGNKDEDVIFTIGQENFKVKDLNLIILLYAQNNKTDLSIEDKRLITKDLFELKLIKRDAVKNKITETATFKLQEKIIRDKILAREFLKTLKIPDAAITEEEMKTEYELNKEKIYSQTEDSESDKPVQKVIPYETVKEEIRQELNSRKQLAVENVWKKKILNDYDVKINKKKLSGK